MTWDRICRRTMEAVGDDTGAALDLLLRRLETVPGAGVAIADVMDAMAERDVAHAAALRAEVIRRKGGTEVITLQK